MVTALTIEKEITTDIEIEVQCKECKEDLAIDATVDNYGDISVEVEPCDNCMDKAVAEAEV